MATGIVLLVVIGWGAWSAVDVVRQDPDARSVYNLDIDTALYDQLATTLAGSWDPGSIPPAQPPGFIAGLALVYRTYGHSFVAARLSLVALLAATAFLLALVLWILVGPVEAVIAAALVMASPLMQAYAATLQYEIVAAFMSLAATTAILFAGRTKGTPARIATSVVAGLLCALAALTREVLIVLAPIGLLVLLFRSAQRPRAWIAAATFVLAFAPPVAWWTVVQHAHSGQYVFLSDKSSVNLRIGNNPAANGTYHLQLQPIEEPSGWAFIAERPADAMRLAWPKVAFFWGLTRDPWAVPQWGAPVLSRMLLGRVRYDVVVAIVRGGALLACFLAGLIVLRRHPALWPLPLAVFAVMGLHILYFSSQRFSVPVFAQIAGVASLALGAAVRAAWRKRDIVAPLLVILAVWGVVTAGKKFPSRYRLEAEMLEGLQAQNVADEPAANGRSRFARAGGERSIAFLSGEVLPRGAVGVRIHARPGTCDGPEREAIGLTVRDGKRTPIFRESFTVGVLCAAPAYAVLPSTLNLRKDSLLAFEVDAPGTVDLWVDRVDVLVGYREIRQVRTVSE